VSTPAVSLAATVAQSPRPTKAAKPARPAATPVPVVPHPAAHDTALTSAASRAKKTVPAAMDAWTWLLQANNSATGPSAKKSVSAPAAVDRVLAKFWQ
jgi:hypothetical protein